MTKEARLAAYGVRKRHIDFLIDLARDFQPDKNDNVSVFYYGLDALESTHHKLVSNGMGELVITSSPTEFDISVVANFKEPVLRLLSYIYYGNTQEATKITRAFQYHFFYKPSDYTSTDNDEDDELADIKKVDTKTKPANQLVPANA